MNHNYSSNENKTYIIEEDRLSELSVANKSDSPVNEEKISIALAESKTIFRLKLFVILFMITAAAITSLLIYSYSVNSERRIFEEAYIFNSYKVMDTLDHNIELTLSLIDTFIVSLVSYARSSGSTWPFVTLPDYAQRVATISLAAKAVVVTQYHIVSKEQRPWWESYASQNNEWVNSTFDEQEHGDHIGTDNPIEYFIHDFNGTREEFDYYLPAWQSFPLVPNMSAYNFDGRSMPFSKVLNYSLVDHEVAYSDIKNREGPGTNGAKALRPEIDPAEQLIDLTYPILANAADSREQRLNTTTEALGVFSVKFFWKDHLTDILPTGLNGIVGVLSNGCWESLTYRIDGPVATFLGVGDLHDTKYDYQRVRGELSDIGYYTVYRGLPITKKGCQYVLELYGSDDMKAVYSSNDPINFALASLLIFAFTSIIFLTYDWWVERRQRKVLRTAIHSSTIVSSLFPANVRDRLFPEDQNIDTKQSQGGPTINRVKAYLKERNPEDNTENTESKISDSTPPIADLFPDATVFFADIAGFTAWSGKREPTSVFTLLECLYGAMDKIAVKRGIFKIETIGDCYVAVTGLPTPRQDHALSMTKFAIECCQEMSKVMRQLEDSLGADTLDLQLRVGIHSGPVIAGVLRGTKSRFQLFGDTVNTASRMESNGMPNRIHVSQATADLLVAAGKSQWLSKRDQLVEAKGKGKMQTYWIEPRLADESLASTPTYASSLGNN